MPIDVHPSLQVDASSAGAMVQAYVRAGGAEPVDWKLLVETAGPGGSSRIAQSGRTDGREDRPVAVVRTNNPGSALLQIYQGGRLLAQIRRDIPAGGD